MGCDQLQSRPPRAGWRSIALRSTVALIRGPTAASCLALSSKDLKRNRDDAEENDPGVFRVVQRIGATHGGEITPLNPSRCVLTIYLWPLQPSKTDESTWIEMRHNEGNSGPKSAEIQGGQVPTPALLSGADFDMLLVYHTVLGAIGAMLEPYLRRQHRDSTGPSLSPSACPGKRKSSLSKKKQQATRLKKSSAGTHVWHGRLRLGAPRGAE